MNIDQDTILGLLILFGIPAAMVSIFIYGRSTKQPKVWMPIVNITAAIVTAWGLVALISWL